ncbi:MAG: methylated-DNA--[protein]-cysteine S-methyltransferase [Candidatus Dormibacteria bacterium]
MIGSTILRSTVIEAPFGPMTLIAEGDTVVASGFGHGIDRLRRHLDDPGAAIDVTAELGEISDRIAGYLNGDATAIDAIAVRGRGSAIMQNLWARLRRVPAGTTVSYSGFGESPRMARVAATACARNPIALIVPCHRVIRSDGGLGGFGGGLPAKRWLLDHEATAAGTAALLAVG